MNWLNTCAEPTNTMRAILSYKGVLYKNHLAKGVAKGALTQDAADKKFEAWVNEKSAKITGKADNIATAKKSAYEKKLADEKAKNEAKAAQIAAKAVPAAEAAPAAEESAPAAEGEASAEA